MKRYDANQRRPGVVIDLMRSRRNIVGVAQRIRNYLEATFAA